MKADWLWTVPCYYLNYVGKMSKRKKRKLLGKLSACYDRRGNETEITRQFSSYAIGQRGEGGTRFGGKC